MRSARLAGDSGPRLPACLELPRQVQALCRHKGRPTLQLTSFPVARRLCRPCARIDVGTCLCICPSRSAPTPPALPSSPSPSSNPPAAPHFPALPQLSGLPTARRAGNHAGGCAARRRDGGVAAPSQPVDPRPVARGGAHAALARHHAAARAAPGGQPVGQCCLVAWQVRLHQFMERDACVPSQQRAHFLPASAPASAHTCAGACWHTGALFSQVASRAAAACSRCVRVVASVLMHCSRPWAGNLAALCFHEQHSACACACTTLRPAGGHSHGHLLGQRARPVLRLRRPRHARGVHSGKGLLKCCTRRACLDVGQWSGCFGEGGSQQSGQVSLVDVPPTHPPLAAPAELPHGAP